MAASFDEIAAEISAEISRVTGLSSDELDRFQDENPALVCPVSYVFMNDPVIVIEGQTYERRAIEAWLKSHGTNPATNTVLPQPYILIPNLALKDAGQTALKNFKEKLRLEAEAKAQAENPNAPLSTVAAVTVPPIEAVVPAVETEVPVAETIESSSNLYSLYHDLHPDWEVVLNTGPGQPYFDDFQESYNVANRQSSSSVSSSSSFSSSHAPVARVFESVSEEIEALVGEIDEDIIYNANKDFADRGYICSITQNIMQDPVKAADGHTYERTAIAKWLETHKTSPLTGASLIDKNLTPNTELQTRIKADLENLRDGKLLSPVVDTPFVLPNPPAAAPTSISRPFLPSNSGYYSGYYHQSSSYSASSNSFVPPNPPAAAPTPISRSVLPSNSVYHDVYQSVYSASSNSGSSVGTLSVAEKERLQELVDLSAELRAYQNIASVSAKQKLLAEELLARINVQIDLLAPNSQPKPMARYCNVMGPVNALNQKPIEQSLDKYLNSLSDLTQISSSSHRPYELYEFEFSRVGDQDFVSEACPPYHGTKRGLGGGESLDQDTRLIRSTLDNSGLDYHLERGNYRSYEHEDGGRLRKVTNVAITLSNVTSAQLFVASRFKQITNVINKQRARNFEDSLARFNSSPISSSSSSSSAVPPMQSRSSSVSSSVNPSSRAVAQGASSNLHSRKLVFSPSLSSSSVQTPAQPQSVSISEPTNEVLVQCKMAGDNAVGKSKLLLQMAEDTFSEDYKRSIATYSKPYDYRVKRVELAQGNRVRLMIHDTEQGLREGGGLSPKSCAGIKVFILCYDVTDKISFMRAERYMNHIRGLVKPDVKIILVATKCDEVNDRVITSEEGQDMASKLKCDRYIETSAKTGLNCQELVKVAAELGVAPAPVIERISNWWSSFGPFSSSSSSSSSSLSSSSSSSSSSNSSSRRPEFS